MDQAQSAQGNKIPIRGVIFDYGNVLCHKQLPSDIESMAQVSDMAPHRFEELYWKFRLPYDCADMNAEAYWQAVAGGHGLVFTPEQIAQLIWLDTQGWARPNHATEKWVEQLHGAGLRLGLLSNMPSDLSQYLKQKGGWVRFFHHLTFSCDVRMAKPDPAIYKSCLERLDLKPNEVIFIDDLTPNLEAAERLGIHGVLFDNIKRTAARVGERFDLPLPDFSHDHQPSSAE
jgi:putative hydrolase of the HAD superfamily